MTDADDTPRFLSNEDIDASPEGELIQKIDWSEPANVFNNIPLADGTFPEGLVPASIEAYARNKSERVGTWPGPIACSILVSAAQAIPHKITIRPDEDQPSWHESAQLFLGITGPSSSNKSIPPKVAASLFKARDAKLREDYERAMKKYYGELDRHKALLKLWTKECAALSKQGIDYDDMPERPKAPVEPKLKRNLVKDVTVEKLVDICADNPNGILQTEDELTRMLGAMGAYSGTAARDQAIYNSAYGAEEFSADRMSRGVYVERMAVCLIGSITEDALRSAFKGKPRDGFLARFLFSRSDSVPVNPGKEDPELLEAVQANINAIMDMDTKSTGFCFVMSPEANKIRADLRNWWLAVNSLPTTGEMTKEHLGKWGGMFARLCLVFQVYENAERGLDQFENSVISEDVARRVEKLLKRYFLPEAVRVYTDVLGDNAVDRSRHIKWIANYILSRSLDKISVRDIVRVYGDWGKLDSREAEQVMIGLETAGWIERRVAGRSRVGGDWSKTKWLVNPQIHDMFAERAKAESIRRLAEREKIAAGSKALEDLAQD